MSKPARSARRALKSGRKAATNKLVNNYAKNGGTVDSFVSAGKSQGNAYKRALQGRGVPKGR